MKENKVDSTKGSSMINPLNYKGDVLVQVWVDSRVLATLCRWMDDQGEYARFMSQVVRRPLEVLAEFVTDHGSELIDDTVEARKMLERRFGVNLNRGGRGTKNVLHNIVLSDKRGELGERLRRNKIIDDADVGSRGNNRSDFVRRAVEKYHEMFKEKMTDEEFEAKSAEIEKADKERIEAERKALDEIIEGMKNEE